MQRFSRCIFTRVASVSKQCHSTLHPLSKKNPSMRNSPRQRRLLPLPSMFPFPLNFRFKYTAWFKIHSCADLENSMAKWQSKNGRMQFTCNNNFLFYNIVDKFNTNEYSIEYTRPSKILILNFLFTYFHKTASYQLSTHHWLTTSQSQVHLFSRKASNLILNRFNFILIKFHHEFWPALYMSRVTTRPTAFQHRLSPTFETKFRRWKDTSSSC